MENLVPVNGFSETQDPIHDVSDKEIREELALLLRSKPFQQSERLARFLTFTVEHTISGKQGDLKEYTIGVEVYDREPCYSPSVDSIVRSEARRLRAKLKEYYEGEGKDRQIFLYYRLGSYVPLFRNRQLPSTSNVAPLPTRESYSPRESKLGIAVIPFRDLCGTPTVSALARGISDELAHFLTTSGAFRVVAMGTVARLSEQGLDITVLASKLGIDLAVEGTVRQEGTEVRITASVANREGFQLGSHRFETTIDGSRMFAIQENIASELADCLNGYLPAASRLNIHSVLADRDVFAERRSLTSFRRRVSNRPGRHRRHF